MHIGNILGGDGPYQAKEAMLGQANSYKPRTIREQLQDRLAQYEAQAANVQEALDALTPDVEKALNALAKV